MGVPVDRGPTYIGNLIIQGTLVQGHPYVVNPLYLCCSTTRLAGKCSYFLPEVIASRRPINQFPRTGNLHGLCKGYGTFFYRSNHNSKFLYQTKIQNSETSKHQIVKGARKTTRHASRRKLAQFSQNILFSSVQQLRQYVICETFCPSFNPMVAWPQRRFLGPPRHFWDRNQQQQSKNSNRNQQPPKSTATPTEINSNNNRQRPNQQQQTSTATEGNNRNKQ